MRNGAPGKQSRTAKILRHLLTYGPATAHGLASVLNCDPHRVQECLRRLLANGAVTVSGGPRNKVWTAISGEDKFTRRAQETTKVIEEAKKPSAPKRNWFDV